MLSFWERNCFQQYDYAVIGSGLVGLSTGISLLERRPGSRVAVLERGIFPAGASTRNAGFACFGSLTEIMADLRKDGPDQTLELVRQRVAGIQRLRQRLGDRAIGYVASGGHELLRREEVWVLSHLPEVNALLEPVFGNEVPVFQENPALRRLAGFAPCVQALVSTPFEAQVDTGLMMQSLLRHFMQLGGWVLTGAEVQSLEYGPNQVSIWLNEPAAGRHFPLLARHVAICTNAFSGPFFPGAALAPGRGQVIYTKPLKHMPFRGNYHFDEGYYYFRDYEDRIIFGGGRNLDFEGETTTHFGENPAILDRLHALLREVVAPRQPVEVEGHWSGIMAFGPSKGPLVEQPYPHVVAGFRLGGMGVALGTTLGEILAERLTA